MDKSVIKNFAVNARIKLKEQIKQKAFTFGITKDETKPVEVFEDTFEVNGNKYNKRLLKHRESLVTKINEDGFDQVIEEVAYTWFNRFIAIRFMEVNEYLSSGVRVLSSTDNNKVEPDIIREAANLDFQNLNLNLIYKLQDENNTEELFKYLLIKQCNELGKIMPVMFEEIEDYTELLLPDNLLQEGSVIRDLVTSIKEKDWEKQVEIIGWLYQFYICEKHDEVVGINKGIIKKEDVPAATQLFTPDWIVKYMVENSLGRLWIESHPNEEINSKWEYYLEEADQGTETQKQLEGIRERNINLKPEDIKFLDPCMGSGHILVYAFDVLYGIYILAGYSEREIPKLILTKNLYGLEIDDRATQLAYFSLLMKARSYNKRIFREKINLNICSINESNDFPKEAIDFLINLKEIEIEKRIHREDVEYLINIFEDAKEYGSILEVKQIDFNSIERRMEEIRNGDSTDIFEMQYKNIILEKIPPLIKQAKIISKRYDIVVTNPPYMSDYDKKLKQFILEKYPDVKKDIFAIFIKKNLEYTKPFGYTAFMTPFVWMFIKTFENLRKYILKYKSISSLVELEYSGFEDATVPICTFVLINANLNFNGTYVKLSDFKGAKNQPIKVKEAVKNSNVNYRYNSFSKDFDNIDGCPIAYWASNSVKKIFKNSSPLSKIADPKQGLATGNNDKYLKLWYEVNINKVGFNTRDQEHALLTNYRWFPCNKGGAYRKWYGNNYYLVDWENNGNRIKKYKGSVIRNEGYYFREGLTWSSLTSSSLSFRYSPRGFIFETKGSVLFPHDYNNNYYLLGYLNSKLVNHLIKMVSPNIDYHEGPMGKLPIIVENNPNINRLVADNIEISKKDWDAFEMSWDFKRNPVIQYKDETNRIENAFKNWNSFAENQYNKLKKNEEELNKIYIEIYGLQDELTPNEDDKDVTISKADRIRDIKSFISYAVGCMFGRYSLDKEGLIFAGRDFNPDKYKTFKIDYDNILPITDDEYFEDDIVSRFVEFVKITFSEETLEENLDFITDALDKKGNETSRQAIRRYFLKDFYKDHIQTHKNRPIYWLFDSGKKDGFKALIYMHRYAIGTVAKVRTDYLHLLQRKYESEVKRLDIVMENGNASIKEKTEARKKKEKIQKQIIECTQYDQVIAHVANEKISIDLDDGVNVNYAKFQGVEVPQGEGKRPLKADLLAKI